MHAVVDPTASASDAATAAAAAAAFDAAVAAAAKAHAAAERSLSRLLAAWRHCQTTHAASCRSMRGTGSIQPVATIRHCDKTDQRVTKEQGV